MESFHNLKVWFLVSFLVFYLPASYPQEYKVGDYLHMKVNSLTSTTTEMPFGYYSLPYCHPKEGIKDSAKNLGELLMGDKIENSPYRFKMYTNETAIFLCQTKLLSSEELKLLKNRIDEMYQVNVYLDNLPAVRYTKKDGMVKWTGYPVGSKFHDSYYIYNHLKFTILVYKHKETNGNYTVVGFEVVPCSFHHDENSVNNLQMYGKYPASISCHPGIVAMAIKENKRLVFSYEVTFVESDIKWKSRWDAYLKMGEEKAHRFPIVHSIMVIEVLAGTLFVILTRTVRRDLAPLRELRKEFQDHLDKELSGWKFVIGDVFRAPSNPSLLCVVVGTGLQILGMAIVTVFFAVFGFMSPASRGMLIIGMLFFYTILGVLAGYVAARLWRTIFCGNEKGWIAISWKVSCFFPCISFLILTVLNFSLWCSNSTGALPLSLFVVLILLWLCISAPLTLIGGYFGAKAPHVEYPVQINKIPREIPRNKYPYSLLILAAGVFPFAILFIELFYIMSSMWMGRVYYSFGYLFIALILVVVHCAGVSLILTYLHLCVEDWKWWWKSFFASGAVAIYVFLYSIHYLIFDLKSLSGPVSVTLYVGYSVFMVIAIMLATGAVGVLSSLWFLHYLYSSMDVEKN